MNPCPPSPVSRITSCLVLAMVLLAASAPAAHATRDAGAADTTVLELTPMVLDRFERSLAAEVAERREVARFLSPDARARYESCQMASYQDTAMAKLMEQQSAASEKGDMAALQRVSQAMMAHLEKKCGVEPSSVPAWKVKERAPAAGAKAGGFEPRQYAMIKERIPPFCAAPADASAEGVRIPGQGKNIFWVYRPGEAQALRPRCDALLKALNAVS